MVEEMSSEEKDKLQQALGKKLYLDVKESPEFKFYVDHFANSIQKKYGVISPKLPRVCIGKNLLYNFAYNTIFISSKNDASRLGDAISEEYGHAMRTALSSNEEDSHHTSEFFGYLSRRLAYDSLSDGVKKKFFSNGVERVRSNKEDLKEIKKAKDIGKVIDKKIDLIEAGKESNPNYSLESLGLMANKNQVDAYHRSILVHSCPYNFASEVDLSKIKDWEKLYSIPDEEVRRRFFRADKDYSGLGEDHKGLEAALESMAVLYLISSSLMSFNLTGDVVANSISGISNLLSAFLFIVGLVASYSLIKLKK